MSPLVNRAPFIKFDTASLRKSLNVVRDRVQVFEARYKEAVTQSTVQYAEHFLSEAQKRAPIDEGTLRGSSTVLEPLNQGDTLLVQAGFNLIYAAYQDQGTKGLPGGVLRPVRAKALFIPLRKGVRPGDPNLVRGVDFVLAKEVRYKGTGYFTLTLSEMKPLAAQAISERVLAILKGGGA